MDSPPAPSFFVRHEFLIRRLHSLSGLVPVGAFMCVHLLTNASVLAGADRFQANVDMIHSLGPALPLVEWAFIFGPLLFHALVGVWIIRSGQPNSGSYPLQGNVRYTLQRATAWIALFFIFHHVFHMHGWVHFDPWLEAIRSYGGQFDPEHATSTAALALAPWWLQVWYAVGILSCVYHFANGLWTMGITWGLWTTPEAQHRANYVCLAVGLLLGVVGLSALYGMSTADVPAAQAHEQVRAEERAAAADRLRRLQGGGDASSPSDAAAE